MRSNYRRIGDFIREVDERNTGLKVKNLLGLSISKEFIPSVANLIGTDMENYKIVRLNQFACSTMQVRRDKKMPVALLKEVDEAIISQAYPVFEITDTDALLPEYLMMWFSRQEFDREACFYAIGGVRGSLEWEDFCNMQLPIPSPDKQKEIVKEYKIITDRIALNERMVQRLEETAQAIYRQWFVDFEFPDEDGKPYKSSGREMEYNEQLKQDIPKAWKQVSIQKLIDDKIIDKNQDGNHGEIHPKSADYVKDGIPFIMAKDIINGTLNLYDCNFISKAQAYSLRIGFAKSGDVLLTHKATMGRIAIVPDIGGFIVLTPQVTYYRTKSEREMSKEYLYSLFASEKFQNILNEQSDQSTRKFLSILNQRLLEVLLPTKNVIELHRQILKPLLEFKRIKAQETILLISMSNILMAKMSTTTKL